MRALLIAIVIIALMVFFGWLTFSSGDGKSTVSLNTEQVKQDTEHAAEATKTAADKAAVKTRKAVDELRHTDVDVDIHRESDAGR